MVFLNNHLPKTKAMKPPIIDATKLTKTAIQSGNIAPAPILTNGVGSKRTMATERAIVNKTGDHMPKLSNQTMMLPASWNKRYPETPQIIKASKPNKALH